MLRFQGPARLLVGVLLLGAALISPGPAVAQPGCEFRQGFRYLASQIPWLVGDCLEDERVNPASGAAEQRTTGGLLVWRAADNATAFTDGALTWLIGPEGDVWERPNDGPLYPWESPPPVAVGTPVAAPAAPAEGPPAASAAPAAATPAPTGSRAGAPASSAGPTRVMPLGDSITLGFGGQGPESDLGGYRARLWERLRAAGFAVDFVGSLRNGPGDIDRDHEGHAGFRIGQVAAAAPGWLRAAAPEVILLHLGTNDLGAGAPTGAAVGSLSRLLDRLVAERPEATVLVASIVGVRTPNAAAIDPRQVADFNAGVRDAATARARQGKQVAFVDMYRRAGLTDADYSADGFHPDDDGYAKMADVWFDALAPLRGP